MNKANMTEALPEYKKLCRDAVSIALAEMRQLEKTIETDMPVEQVEELVNKSMSQIKDLVSMSIDTWPAEVKDAALKELVTTETQGRVARLTSTIAIHHLMTGQSLVELAELAFKKAQEMAAAGAS